jgi:hypothetical protein
VADDLKSGPVRATERRVTLPRRSAATLRSLNSRLFTGHSP